MPKKLPPGEALARHIARNKAKNEKRKADLKAYKLSNGICPQTSEQKKAKMREYIRAKRAEQKALKPPKPVQTAEQKRLKANEKQKRAYARKIAKDGRTVQPRTKRTHKPAKVVQPRNPKPIKMQKAIRQSPPTTTSTYHKPDHFKQPALKIINNSTEGKIKVIIKPGFEVFVSPGSDIEQVKAKYLNR